MYLIIWVVITLQINMRLFSSFFYTILLFQPLKYIITIRVLSFTNLNSHATTTVKYHSTILDWLAHSVMLQKLFTYLEGNQNLTMLINTTTYSLLENYRFLSICVKINL